MTLVTNAAGAKELSGGEELPSSAPTAPRMLQVEPPNAPRRERVRPPRGALALRFGAALLLAGVLAWLFWRQLELVQDFRIDDAYITFSFSKNLGLGRGPIYGFDGRVEGYSNFLWMLVVAIGYALRHDLQPYALVRPLSYFSLAMMAFAIWRLSRRHAGPVASAVVLLVLANSTDLARAAASGLETVAHASLLSLAILWYLREPPSKRTWSLFGFVAVALIRIDGFVPLLYVLGFEVADAALGGRLRWRALGRWAGPPLLLYGLWFLWQWRYYGLPLPTTYYAKALVDAGNELRADDYAWDFVRALGLGAFLPFALFGVARRLSRDTMFVALFVGGYGAYVLRTGGDWMPFWRFFIPLLAPLFVLTAWGFSATWRASSRWPNVARVVPAGAMAWACVFVARHADAHEIETAEERAVVVRAAQELTHTRDNLLRAIPLMRAIVRQPGDRLATDYGGVFAVYTDASVIEYWGLCNEAIALRGGLEGINPIYGKSCPRCIAEASPDYFHVGAPLRRSPRAFRNIDEVLRNVFLSSSIGRYIDWKRDYAVGRATDVAEGDALWFLERRRAGAPLETRTRGGIVVDYPFER